jgi:cell division septation protein DedD
MPCVRCPCFWNSSGRAPRPWLFVLMLGTALAGCGAAPNAPPARQPRVLPPDSAALLQAALCQAQPAFALQDEALHAGTYARPAPVFAEHPPVPPTETADAGTYVIQIAAFRNRYDAESAASVAAKRFPEFVVGFEAGAGLVRVVLHGPRVDADPHVALAAVRRHHRDAWLRRGIP